MIHSRTFGSGIQGKNYLQLQSTRPRPEFSRLVGFILLDHFSLLSCTQALDTLVTANLLAAATFATRTYSPTGAEVLSDLGIVIRQTATTEPWNRSASIYWWSAVGCALRLSWTRVSRPAAARGQAAS